MKKLCKMHVVVYVNVRFCPFLFFLMFVCVLFCSLCDVKGNKRKRNEHLMSLILLESAFARMAKNRSDIVRFCRCRVVVDDRSSPSIAKP